MTAKAKHCDECEHFDSTWAAQAAKVVCKLKHKPRFYRPKDDVDPHDSSWGWKRKCEDFKSKDAHDHPTDS